jgi:hypothetical protein
MEVKMEHHDIEELMALDWATEIHADPDGGFVLTVQCLIDFAVYGASEADVQGQFNDALRSHLAGYLATGKIVPIPSGRVMQELPETGGGGDWMYLEFDAATGMLQKESALA